MLLTRCLLVMTSGQRNLAQLITVSGGCGTLGIERTVSFVRSWSQVGPRLGNVPRTRRYRRSMPDSACSGAILREYGNDPRVSNILNVLYLYPKGYVARDMQLALYLNSATLETFKVTNLHLFHYIMYYYYFA